MVLQFRGDWLLIAGSADSLSARGRCGKYSASAGPGQDGLSLRFAALGPAGAGKAGAAGAPVALDVISQAVAGDKVALAHAVYRKQGDADYEGGLCSDQGTTAYLPRCRVRVSWSGFTSGGSR